MKTNKLWLIGINLALLLLFVNWSIIQKERTLAEGTLVLMELAPVDPRSLMQGDYMVLNYAATGSQLPEPKAKRGFLVIRLDSGGVARPVRYQAGKTPRGEGEHLIRYFRYEWQTQIGAESYFFQEGQAEKFAGARYGGLRVDRNGNSVLTGLYDSTRRFIAP